jgi:hypothetical protein
MHRNQLRYDNKIRLSQDILEKAELIAAEWGLKNARAAVEAVFRRYSDDYLNGRGGRSLDNTLSSTPPTNSLPNSPTKLSSPTFPKSSQSEIFRCEALNELEDLLGI